MLIDNKFIEDNKGNKITVTFKDGSVLKNIKLFVSSTGNFGYLSGRQKRRGSFFPLYREIEKIDIINKKVKIYDNIKNAQCILKKIHPNAWVEIQENMKRIINGGEPDTDFEWHFKGKLNLRNISSLLNTHEKNRLVEAFENKTDYNWSKPTYHHRGRDLSISTKMGDDGKFRAWFSSEYMGCGNGDYYLLLNPTTAIFYETD